MLYDVICASSRKSQVRHPVSHQQVPRVQAYFQASCKCASDQPLGCRRVLALNAKSVQLAYGALHTPRVPPHCASGRKDQMPESPQRKRACRPVVVRARCAHSTSCAQRSARGSRRCGREKRAARGARERRARVRCTLALLARAARSPRPRRRVPRALRCAHDVLCAHRARTTTGPLAR